MLIKNEQNVCINVAMESSSSIANYLWRGALRTPQYSHAQKCFFFSFHTQQRICCRAILPKILLTLEMPHYYHWFSVKNHNHLIHTMCGYIYIYIMGFCAFLLLKSCHCCWGNPFPRSINHKVQQHNNINMWRPDNSDWPDVALVENSLTKLIFFRP